MQRVVVPERMDLAPPSDPEAIRARRGLRRVNRWMGNPSILARTIEHWAADTAVHRLVDLGAGDGTFTLAFARRLRRRWPQVELILVDRHNLLRNETVDQFRALGWSVRAEASDVFSWLAGTNLPIDVMIANLFLHHFDRPALSDLLALIASRTRIFAACDPLRSRAALRVCPLLWLLGCNQMVRHDAAISVRAGFLDSELSALWPKSQPWTVEERRAGLCTHLFCAKSGVHSKMSASAI